MVQMIMMMMAAAVTPGASYRMPVRTVFVKIRDIMTKTPHINNNNNKEKMEITTKTTMILSQSNRRRKRRKRKES